MSKRSTPDGGHVPSTSSTSTANRGGHIEEPDEAIDEEIQEMEERERARREAQINVIDFTELETLCATLRANENDAVARAKLERVVQRTFKENGGVPINLKNPLPLDLKILSNDELINVIDNMQIFLNRTRKSEFVARCISIFQDGLRMFTNTSKVPDTVYNYITQDDLLREAMVTTFFGPSNSISPVSVIGISLLSYLVRIAVSIKTATRKEIEEKKQALIDTVDAVATKTSTTPAKVVVVTVDNDGINAKHGDISLHTTSNDSLSQVGKR